METPTLSRQPNMLSRKAYNGFTTAPSKAIYDDVFGGGPKFGAPALSPRVEDYAEIFGGFRTSRAASIPVLDLPLVDDQAADVCFDVRGSGFDYAEVFGGFDGRDFAVSYEELVRMMEQANGRDDSSNEAWTPAEADNPSDESDHSAKHQRFSNGDSSESIDGYTEFSISYNKAGQNCNGSPSNGIRHTTQLHDPSGYTFVVDKATSLPNSDALYTRHNGAYHIVDNNEEFMGQRHLTKAMSQPANSSNGPFFGDDVKPHGEFVRNGSTFLSISDVSLRTRPSDLPPPSRPPPALDVEKGYSDKTTPSCRSVASEGSVGENSPPYFDVEVDASSSAAMKDAMKKAQAKLKTAKESMERKQEAFHSRRNSDSKILRRIKEEKLTKLINGFGSVRGAGGGQGVLQGGEDNVIEFSVMDETHELKKTSRIISDSLEGNYSLKTVKKSVEENKGRESLSSQGSDFIDVTGEWKEASQFFELVTNKSKKVFVQANEKTVLEHDLKCYERQKKEKRANVEGLQGHRGNGVKVGANCELEFIEMASGIPIRAFKCDKSFERSEMANKQKILDKRVQITDEACREEQIEKKFSIDLQTGETGKRRVKAYDLQKHSNSEKADGQSTRHKDKSTQFVENNRSMGNVKKFPQGKEESDRRSRDTLRFEENEKKAAVTHDPAETEIKTIKVTPQEEKERTKRAVFEQEENEKTLREFAEWKLSERLQKETLEKEDKERKLKETFENEERLRRKKEAAEQEENEKRRKEICEREENEKKRREMLEREANEKRLKEARDLEENERRLKENLEKEERKRRHIKAIEQEEKAKRELEEKEKKLNQALEKEEMQRRQREAILKEDNENRERLENERRLKQALEKEEMQRRQREVAELENAKRKREEISERIKEPLESEPGERKEEVCLKPENEGREKSSKLLSNLRNVEVATVSGPEEKTNEKIKRCQVNLDAGNQGVKSSRERNDLMSDDAVKERDESGRKGAQFAMEVKGSNHRADQQLHRSQSTTQKGKNDTLQQVDEESQRMKKERDMELERLRKMEEEREREREREKDRMAVDRTILETRERVYAERATMERATAEVRQRALNDARERLEKACAEAKEKSFPDNKASVESRIRAERAAVERATAEARERAFEKAMAERNAFERSASDKFSASSRNGGFRPNSASYELHNQQSQGAGCKHPHIIAKGSKHQYSSVDTERFGAEGESPQRCKARLERHRRTAERAANALEELNMRDLHAQREQAERNRLAETLDAEVKRWSSGKEGNLRALLSTLQYILGPDSGWQPIHLTEVITAAAVKKAYRKATLCVHPDKLQQRGASIQQKYVCEKVFDLLKEAWNRFNSEER